MGLYGVLQKIKLKDFFPGGIYKTKYHIVYKMDFTKEDHNIAIALTQVLQTKDMWLRMYNHSINIPNPTEEQKKDIRAVMTVFNIITSTRVSGVLLERLLQTNRKELKMICLIATLYVSFEDSMDDLEDAKDRLNSLDYVERADFLKYMYDLRHSVLGR